MFLNKISTRATDIRLIAKIIVGIFLSISLASCNSGSGSSGSPQLSQVSKNSLAATNSQTVQFSQFALLSILQTS